MYVCMGLVRLVRSSFQILKLSIVELSISRLGFWVLRIGQEMDLRGKMNKDL